MTDKRRVLFILLLFGAVLNAQERPTPFHPDSALAMLRHLIVDIGPRPMGSPAEQRALAYAVERFRAFGLDKADFLPFTVAPSSSNFWINTNSGTAVGILKGKTDRIIVIGGHIDSASPEVPGANDDGSGSAVVLELARVMAGREWESTFVFCLFGGEEAGLKGSYHFVANFPDIDKVALMLQVDMANGVEWLLPLFDIRAHSAPQWLVEASYEEFFELGHSGLSYPTHFFSINAPVGGASSDHQPFLERNIPAIDFTSDVRDPIHTRQDSWEGFRPGGLERSGDLVYRLAERFDGGVPEEKIGSYMTFQLGATPSFLSHTLLWIFMGISTAASVWVVIHLRRSRVEMRGGDWKKIPGIKVMALTLMVVSLGWLSEDILGFLSGLRSPWFAHPSDLLPYGFAAAGLAYMFAARLSRRMTLSGDEYRYALRSLVTLLIYMSLTSLVGPRLASYDAFGMMFVSMAFFGRNGLLSVTLVLLGAYPTARLIFSEVFDFVARLFSQIPPGFGAVAFNIILILLLTGLAAPYALALAGVLRSSRKTWPSPGFAVEKPALLFLFGALIVTGYLVLQNPAYTDDRRQYIEILQEAFAGNGELTTSISSNDALSGATISFASADTVVQDNVTEVKLPPAPFDADNWLSTETRPVDQGSHTARFSTSVKTPIRPYTLEVRFIPSRAEKGVAISSLSADPYAVRKERVRAALFFSAFPDTSLTIPFTISLSEPDTVIQTIVATFAQDARPVGVEKPNSSVVRRTAVRSESRFFVSVVQ